MKSESLRYAILDKVKAIQDLPAPHNVPELRQVLGMINYLGRFLPNLLRVVSPISELNVIVLGIGLINSKKPSTRSKPWLPQHLS